MFINNTQMVPGCNCGSAAATPTNGVMSQQPTNTYHIAWKSRELTQSSYRRQLLPVQDYFIEIRNIYLILNDFM